MSNNQQDKLDATIKLKDGTIICLETRDVAVNHFIKQLTNEKENFCVLYGVRNYAMFRKENIDYIVTNTIEGDLA